MRNNMEQRKTCIPSAKPKRHTRGILLARRVFLAWIVPVRFEFMRVLVHALVVQHSAAILDQGFV